MRRSRAASINAASGILIESTLILSSQLMLCHSLRGQNTAWPSTTGILAMAASFNEKPIMAGFIKKWSSWSSRRCDCQLVGSRSRRSTSRDDEGDKGLMGPHRTLAARYPLDERGCGMHFFPQYSSFASRLFDGHPLGNDSRWIVTQPTCTAR